MTDRGGASLTISRDYKMSARQLVSPAGQRCKLTTDSMDQLASFVTPDNVTVHFTYLGNSGLIESKETGAGRAFVYDYDDYGRMSAVIQPTGDRVVIAADRVPGLNSCFLCGVPTRFQLYSLIYCAMCFTLLFSFGYQY